MKSWPSPFIPAVPGTGLPVRVFDTASGAVHLLTPGPTARMYVCGITPYDATHIGHAATYVTFDLLGRALRDAGHEVLYVQNVTDVDEPLLERAHRDGVSWHALAAAEIALFREDMTALAVIAPDHYIGAVEGVPSVVKAVTDLLSAGTAYRVDVPEGEVVAGATDIYFDLSSATESAALGSVSSWDRDQMMAVYAERGGDPDRPGKRDELDPLLWRAARAGEPSWPGGDLGDGRPGWHIECTTIALDYLGMTFDVQGGGTDLIFPHHEMSAVQACGITGASPFARAYVHQAMVGLDGEKMSKSKGNLVLVSTLRQCGIDPMAIRLAVLAHHYRTPWEWNGEILLDAQDRLATWRAGLSGNGGPSADSVVARIRECLADDLDAPGALAAVDEWVRVSLAEGGTEAGSPGLVGRAVDALLGVRL
ncbi:MAG TPA: cysteine--1-D-myo-inosityl 2-amino-2-deoxy-alpha-D-glucopyranoside ligase [Dermatophilaceae bacterium]|nr:cysteine--1-D-myo-inosityl 2-amino-2-deoxy-alpha-D-glucopyranoside ligase [Dermatophilaceae bacterium]